MTSMDVKKCIVCLKPATIFSGRLIKYKGQHINKAVGAGFCDAHQDTYCPNFNGSKGCFGYWKKKYGIKEVEV